MLYCLCFNLWVFSLSVALVCTLLLIVTPLIAVMISSLVIVSDVSIITGFCKDLLSGDGPEFSDQRVPLCFS